MAPNALLNLLSLPPTDILSLFLFITALGYHLLLCTIPFSSQNLALACLLEVANAFFWHGISLNDVDLDNIRIMRSNLIEKLNVGAEPELSLVELSGQRCLDLLAKFWPCNNAFYQICVELWMSPLISPIYGSAVYTLLGLNPDKASAIWRFILIVQFFRPLTMIFDPLLLLSWIYASMNNLENVNTEQRMERLSQLRDETTNAVKLLLLHWAVSLRISQLFGSIFPTSSSRIHDLVEKILGNKLSYKALLHSKAEDAQMALGVLQKVLNDRHLARELRLSTKYAMMRLSTASGTFPHSLILRNIRREGREPFTSGGFSEIWKGSYGNVEVSLKVAKLTLRSDNERLMRELAREAILWNQLEHPNILPFFGVHPLGDTYGRIALVSPWEENGNVTSYLGRNSEAPRFPLIFEVLMGLQYLHDHNIVHGDLKGANILVSANGHLRLADFGMSSVVDANVLRWTSLSTMTQLGGTIRWMAPELIGGLDDSDIVRPTFASDVYSLASVTYEILTGQLPFHEIRSNVTVMSKIIQGMKPTMPSFVGLELSIEIWTVMDGCWNSNPEERPGLCQITHKLRNIGTPELTTKRIQVWNKDHEAPTPPQPGRKPDILKNSQFTIKDAIVLAKYMVCLV